MNTDRNRPRVTSVCPEGHVSDTPDFCGVCGKPVKAMEATPETVPSDCPNCGAPLRTGEECPCGYVVAAPDGEAPWEQQVWEIVAWTDREFYEQNEAEAEDDELPLFPEKPARRRIPLVGDHARIGRHSKTRGIEPEIDLFHILGDPSVSARHAVLMRQPEGDWALVDQESTNGTFLNRDEDPVAPNQPVPLSDGDHIHVGTWSTLTIERLDAEQLRPFEVVDQASLDTRNLARARRMRVAIDILGPLRLSVSHEEVHIGSPKERAVLTLLALRVGTFVSTADLESAAWGENEPANARQQTQNYIRAHRTRLPGNAIEFVANQGYRLNVPKDCMDIHRFERYCARGNALLGSGHPGAAVAWLGRALELWRGEPLADLSDGTMAAADVTRLLGRRANAEEDLFDGRLQLGHHYELLPDLRAAVEAEPDRPRRRRQLMLALYRSGQQGDAMTEYQSWRERGRDRGLNPDRDQDLFTLEQEIAMDNPDLQWSPPVTPGAAPT